MSADERLTFTPVSVGNPHAVIRRDFADDEIALLGPLVENHQRFPERTNVQLVRVVGPHELRIGIWERGAGETTASGSSSVAAAAAAVANGLVREPGHGRASPAASCSSQLGRRPRDADGPGRAALDRDVVRRGARRSGSSSGRSRRCARR